MAESDSFSGEVDRSTAPFNMALRTLEKIHNILAKIVFVSAVTPFDEGGSYNKGRSQHIKYYLVRQLFIQSIPLFTDKKTLEWREGTHKLIKDLKTKLIVVGINDQNGMTIKAEERYDPMIDDILDDLTIDIQDKLQKEGYFMPPRYDARYSWRQD